MKTVQLEYLNKDLEAKTKQAQQFSAQIAEIELEHPPKLEELESYYEKVELAYEDNEEWQ